MTTRDHEPLTPDERDLAQRLARLDGHAAPSASLDAGILAAARTAVTAPPAPAHARTHRRSRPRWPFGVGIAASLAVALGIAWQLRPQPENAALPALSEASLPPQDAPAAEVARPAPPPAAAAADSAYDNAPTGVAPVEAAPAEAEAEPERALRAPAPPPEHAPVAPVAPPMPAAEAPIVLDQVLLKRAAAAVEETERRQRSEAVLDVVAPAAPAPAPPPPPPAPAAAASETRGFTASPANAGAAMPATAIGTGSQVARERSTAAQSAAAAEAKPSLDRIVVTGSRIDRFDEDDAAADQAFDDQPPASADSPQVRDAWLKRIRELRAAGQLDDARASLREFIRRHPDTAVPDDLRPLLGE